MILFGGVSSDAMRVIVEYYPQRHCPERKIEKISIPGRSGDLLLAQDAFENYTQTYDVYLSAEKAGLPRVARAAMLWLQGQAGYQRLEESYDPECYRLACFAGPLDVENIFNRFGRATIAFDCKPQRWLKSGERTLQLAKSGDILHNPGMAALPLLTVYGSGPGTVTAGGATVQIKALDGNLTLDCDTQDAYNGTQNKNGDISAPVFPTLPPGDSAVTWTGGVQRVEIVPRWWTL